MINLLTKRRSRANTETGSASESAGLRLVARIDLVVEHPSGWLSDVLGVPSAYPGHKLFCVGCALFDHQNWMQVSHYTALLWILTSWRGTLPMEAWEYQAGDCFRGGLVA